MVFILFLFNFMIGLLLGMIILILPLFFYKKKKEIFQIESGFETISKTSLKSFSINFFYILIIFIVFDLEMAFLFTFINKMSIFVLSLILIFIMLTLWMEWILNKIKWIN